MPPSISVVVTCYNYGHFLSACLDSLDAQTRKPAQIIVVDDGSQDASREIARRRAVTLVEKANGGQASAFNEGFALCTGDIVIFLDADDTLVPDALEIVGSAWHHSVAAISFGMNLIDAAGRLCGYYSVEPNDGDMRPELLSRGHFDFMPTSGNAFNRRMVAAMFPLPEERWRVSADTVLIRAAALAGPIRQLPFVLAHYRAHGGNSYHRSAMPRLQSMQRAVQNMVDANLSVARLDAGPELFGSDPDIVRLGLLLAAIRIKLGSIDTSAAVSESRIDLRTVVGDLLRLRIGLRAKMVYGLCFAMLRLAVPLSTRVRLWAALPEIRPRIVSGLLARLLGNRLHDRRRDSHRMRALQPLDPGSTVISGGSQAMAFLNSFDWRVRSADSTLHLCHPAGEVLLAVAHHANGADLVLDVAGNDPDGGAVNVSVAAEGKLLHESEIAGPARILISLEPATTIPERPMRLVLSARPAAAGFAAACRSLGRPAALLSLRRMTLEPRERGADGLLLMPGVVHRYAEIADISQVSPKPKREDRGRPVETGRLVLSFVRPRQPGKNELVLSFGRAQIDGILVVSDPTEIICKAVVGPYAVLRIAVRPRSGPDDRDLTLTFELDPTDVFEAAIFAIDAVSLSGSGSWMEKIETPNPTMIAVGAIHTFADETASDILGDGWAIGESGAELFDVVGLLRFTVDPYAPTDAALLLAIAPVADQPDGQALAVAVTVDGDLVAEVLIQDELDLLVPLGRALGLGRRQLDVAIHAALPMVEGSDIHLRRGSLLLRSARLAAMDGARPTRTPPAIEAGDTLSRRIVMAGAQARAFRSGTRPVEPADVAMLAASAKAIAADIGSLARTAVTPILLDEQSLDCLLVIGQMLADAGEAVEIAGPAPDYAAAFEDDRPEAVRALALAMLAAPPWRVLAGRDPATLSDGWRALPAVSALYLCSTSHRMETRQELEAYQAFAVTLLDYARACFCSEVGKSRHALLAEGILRHFNPLPALFSGGNLKAIADAFGGALESYLVMQGHRITLLQTPEAGPAHCRLRLGVLVRDFSPSPETHILAGTIGALPPRYFDVTVFVLDRHEDPPAALRDHVTVIDLDGAGIARSVETIRAAGLDVFLLGTGFQSYGDVAPIVAHRLAPLQIASSAVSPMTTGLRSFDVMLSAEGCEPQDAQSHYAERLELAAEPVQRFEFAEEAAPPAPNRAIERIRRGIPADAVVMTSGAMIHKIGQDLLESWIAILAVAPDTVLVLYPLAANWKLAATPSLRLRRDIDRACRLRGVDAGRVHVLPSMPRREVATVLAISDLYLDSFPYAGATTVVEAMRAGLPVVTLAGDSQRGLQGAAWARTCGLDRFVAASPGDYVRIATELAGSAQARQSAASSIAWPTALERGPFGQRLAGTIARLAGHDLSASTEPVYAVHDLDEDTAKAVRKPLGSWFRLVDADRLARDGRADKTALETHAAAEMLQGRFDGPDPLLRRRADLIASGQWRLVTWLRDPLETAIARHALQQRRRRPASATTDAQSLEAFLETCPPYLAQHLHRLDDDWRTALDRYWFVGTLDRLDEGMAWLATALDRHSPESARSSAARPSMRPPEAVMERFARRNRIDYDIYRAAAAREDRLLGGG